MAKIYRLKANFKGGKSHIVPIMFDTQKKAIVTVYRT